MSEAPRDFTDDLFCECSLGARWGAKPATT